MVGLRTGDKYRCFRVHRLVAQAFLPLPNEGETVVERIDGNPQNNYIKFARERETRTGRYAARV